MNNDEYTDIWLRGYADALNMYTIVARSIMSKNDRLRKTLNRVVREANDTLLAMDAVDAACAAEIAKLRETLRRVVLASRRLNKEDEGIQDE